MHEKLVPWEKQTTDGVSVYCVHGDQARYPVAEVVITVGNKTMTVMAGVSGTLPVSVLLGTDVPQLMELLNEVPTKKKNKRNSADDKSASKERAQVEGTGGAECVRGATHGEKWGITRECGRRSETIQRSLLEELSTVGGGPLVETSE